MLCTQFLSTVDELYNIATKLNVCFVFMHAISLTLCHADTKCKE